MSRTTRSTSKLQPRRSIHYNNSLNLTDEQNDLSTSKNRRKQNSNNENDPQENSSSESEHSVEDNESMNSSQHEETNSSADSEIQEEQETEINKKENAPESKSRELYIPESAISSARMRALFGEKPSIDASCSDRQNVPAFNRQKKSEKIESNFFQDHKILVFGVAIIIVIIILSFIMFPEKERIDWTLIKKSFPTQDEELWDAFEAGVEDVVTRQRPSTFILLYSQEAEQTLKKILPQLSEYAVCNITGCKETVIEITDTELNSPQVVREYGTFIETYRPKVEQQGVMIIKNLEKVRGISAQAFHSFCDEVTPLVEKSLFIFTMKVDELPSSSDRMKFTEEYLKNKWTDINVDILNALITRITGMVLEVRA